MFKVLLIPPSILDKEREDPIELFIISPIIMYAKTTVFSKNRILIFSCFVVEYRADMLKEENYGYDDERSN